MDPAIDCDCNSGAKKVQAFLRFEPFEVMRPASVWADDAEKRWEMRIVNDGNRTKFVKGRVVRFWYAQSFTYKTHRFWVEYEIEDVVEVNETNLTVPSFYTKFSTGFTVKVFGGYLLIKLGKLVNSAEREDVLLDGLWDEYVLKKSLVANWRRQNVEFCSGHENGMKWSTKALWE